MALDLREGVSWVNLSSGAVWYAFVCLEFLLSWAIVSPLKPCSVEQMVRGPECELLSPCVLNAAPASCPGPGCRLTGELLRSGPFASAYNPVS